MQGRREAAEAMDHDTGVFLDHGGSAVRPLPIQVTHLVCSHYKCYHKQLQQVNFKSHTPLFAPKMASHLTPKIAFRSQSLPSAFSHPNRRRSSISVSSSTIRLSSSSTIEHIVLFKLKPQTPPSKLSAMLNGLNDLKSLNRVLHLTAGPIHHTTTNFTHMLHSRYNSKSDLSTYASHPDHVSVVRESVLPICDDLMAVDWISHSPSLQPIIPPPNSAMRITFLKLKNGLPESDKLEAIEVVKGSTNLLGKIVQSSVGENFSPARAKGFSIASLAVYPTLKDLEEVGILEEQRKKLGKFLDGDGVMAVDYVVVS